MKSQTASEIHGRIAALLPRISRDRRAVPRAQASCEWLAIGRHYAVPQLTAIAPTFERSRLLLLQSPFSIQRDK